MARSGWHPEYLLVLLISGFACAGEVDLGEPLPIDTTIDIAAALDVADADGDGDLDVFSAAWLDGCVWWWSNDDGDGTSWTRHVIDEALDGPRALHAADIDGDGDVDLAGAIAGNADLFNMVWWERMDEAGDVWMLHVVDFDFIGAHDVRMVDIDNDGDLDMIGVAYVDQILTWWEQIDAGANEWIRHDVAAGLEAAFTVRAGDVNGDGAPDLVVTATTSGRVAWWENRLARDEAWIERDIALEYDGATGLDLNDVDQDGDLDVVTTAELADEINWWENVDGLGTTWTEHVVAARQDGALTVATADIDGDSDPDLVTSALFTGASINWWENATGDGSSWVQHPLTEAFDFGIVALPADMNGDGLIDVVGGLYQNDTTGLLAWWRSGGATCAGDVNGDGVIGPADLASLLNAWGPNAGHPADVNGDDIVNAADLAALLDAWGPCPS